MAREDREVRAPTKPGEGFWPDEPRLVASRRHCRVLLRAFNAEPHPHAREAMLRQILGHVGEGARIEPPFVCDYGVNISLSDRVFLNTNCVVLDGAAVSVGSHTQIGPGVQLLTADHPRDPDLRRSGFESALPITIGENVWIGGGAIVCPGVTVGDDSIIGAGAVVVRDVAPRVVAAGNPARVLRTL